MANADDDNRRLNNNSGNNRLPQLIYKTVETNERKRNQLNDDKEGNCTTSSVEGECKRVQELPQDAERSEFFDCVTDVPSTSCADTSSASLSVSMTSLKGAGQGNAGKDSGVSLPEPENDEEFEDESTGEMIIRQIMHGNEASSAFGSCEDFAEDKLNERDQEMNPESDDGEFSLELYEDKDNNVENASDDDEGSAGYCMPPHNWQSYSELVKREYGLRPHEYPQVVQLRASGSLHMVQRFELMYKLQQHDGCVNCLNFNASGTRVLSGSDDLNVTVWDWAINQPLLTFESEHRANVFQVKYLPLSGECHIATCARDGQVRLAELSAAGTCRGTRKLAQHRGAAHKLALDADSPHVFLSCGEDGVVFQVDIRDDPVRPNKLLTCKEMDPSESSSHVRETKVPLYSIHGHPMRAQEFAVSGRDQWCRVYDKRMLNAENSRPMKRYCPDTLKHPDQHKCNITCVVYNYNGTELLASYNDEQLYTFNTNHSDGADAVHCYKGHRNNATVKGVNYYGPKSEFIVSGSDCGHIYFWEHDSETVVQFMAGDEGGVVNCLEPHPTCPVLATSGLDHDVKIWIPTCEDPKLNVKELNQLMRRNQREREQERTQEHELFDSHMLWMVLSRMRRAAHRAAQEHRGGEDADGQSSSTDSALDDDDDDDEENASGSVTRCRTS